ncbi:B12-binding domain-containing radical SAM protein [Polaribacter sp. SA4-12]|uniref:B12-binding domain-containing radical SAM protein n=1 Tax=Polaribacter sp. SA4-12 TaxID=1312072 RepID=UPI000B3C55E1|nr:radical SAM protein [Polaribacter sp. SA4-12]ARV14254.1 hypothetical protein BTO07_03400 [Polaribacter sp. SA4-12]
MKNLLIISFDFIREGESETSLAIGSILSYIKNDIDYGIKFKASHLPINVLEFNENFEVSDLNKYLSNYNFNEIDYIAISAYVWNEFITNSFINLIINKYNFTGKVILGGYQISYSNNPVLEYPNCHYFIDGYAENALLSILKNENNSKVLKSNFDFSNIPSPYLTDEIQVDDNQEKVRVETQRGCPYRCNFCAHRDLTNNKVYKQSFEKTISEFKYFRYKKVEKVNVLDPIFNIGSNYLNILNELVKMNYKSLISIQVRFETIIGDKGLRFLDLCEKLNIHLEFGLQTAIIKESILINRKNNPSKIKSVMHQLNKRNISYEVSLIYGLPTQTVTSFKKSISFLIENGCEKIIAFPLMLLKGTELFQEKEKFSLKEENIGEYNIPLVTSSNSFSKNNWLEMKKIANNLKLSNKNENRIKLPLTIDA